MINEDGETVVSDVFDENTHKYEEFSSKTIHDFDGQTVLSIDGSEDNNFFVVSDDVTVVRSEGEFDIFIDEDTGDITITGDLSGLNIGNATEKIILIDNGEVIHAVIDTVEQYDQTIVMKQNSSLSQEEQLEEFFDYIKVDSSSINHEVDQREQKKQNTPKLLSNVNNPKGEDTADDLTYMNIKADYITIFKWDSDDIFDKKDEEDKNAGNHTIMEYHYKDCEFSGSVDILFKIRHDVKVYGKRDLKVTYGVKLEGKLKFRLEQYETTNSYGTDKIQTKKLKYRVAPLVKISLGSFIYTYIDLNFVYELKYSRELSASVSIKYEHVVAYNEAANDNKKQTLFNDFNFTPEITADAKVVMFVGFEADVGVALGSYLIDKRIIDLGIEGKLGITATAEVGGEYKFPPAKSIHACYVCSNVSVVPTIKLTFKITIIKWKISYPVEFELFGEDGKTKFYLSLLNSEDSVHEGKVRLGCGDCPNVLYLQKIYALDRNEKPYDVDITGEFKLSEGILSQLSESILSQSVERTKRYHGESLLPQKLVNDELMPNDYYLYNGKYFAYSYVDDKVYGREFEVNKDNQEINIFEYNIKGCFSEEELGALLDVNVKVFNAYESGKVASLFKTFQTASGIYQGTDDTEKVTYSRGVINEYFIIPLDYEYLSVQIECDGYKPYTIQVSIPNNTGVIDLGYVKMVKSDSDLDPYEVNQDQTPPHDPITRDAQGYEYLADTQIVYTDKQKYTYTVNTSNRTATITGYTGEGNYYFIPETVSRTEKDQNGKDVVVDYTVTAIADKAFQNHTIMRGFYLPKSVQSVGNYAFAGCSGIEDIYLTEISSLGSHAFEGCTNARTIAICGPIKSIGAYTFSGCAGVTEMCMPSTLTSIGEYAFNGCRNIRGMEIPNRVKTIGTSAFYGCSSLKSLTIPSSVETIYQNAFAGCTSLEELTVNANLVNYNARLYKNIMYAASVNIPYTNGYYNDSYATDIAANDFRYSRHYYFSYGIFGGDKVRIKKLTFGDEVTQIGAYAFYGCTGLEEVHFGNGLTTIHQNAFEGCTNLTDIYYPGSEEAFKTVSIGGSNSAITNAVKHYDSVSTSSDKDS